MKRNSVSRGKHAWCFYLGIFMALLGIAMVVVAANSKKQQEEERFNLGFSSGSWIRLMEEDVLDRIGRGVIDRSDERCAKFLDAEMNIIGMALKERRISNEVIKEFDDAALQIIGTDYIPIGEIANDIDIGGFMLAQSFFYYQDCARECYYAGVVSEDEYIKYVEDASQVLDNVSKSRVESFLKYSKELLGDWIERM